ncbi:MAG: hypothetical protein JJ975_12530 [Bacteroidia bacterium]|nr:hypothetical protein [Bacteroidia bacterium]
MGSVAHAQNSQQLAQRVNSLQSLRLQNIFTEQRDSLFTLFDSSITVLMRDQEFHSNPIDSSLRYFYNGSQISNDTNVTLTYAIMSTVLYCNSSDNKLRTYTCDDLGGGCGHSYRNYLVYKKKRGDIGHYNLDTGRSQSDTEGYSYFGTYDVKTLKKGRRTLYFLYGFGTFCGSSAYKNIRIFEFNKDTLRECFECYPNKKSLELHGNRRHYLHFTVDPKTLDIRYRQYLFDDDSGFYHPDKFEDIVLRFRNGVYVKE